MWNEDDFITEDDVKELKKQNEQLKKQQEQLKKQCAQF